MTAITKEQALRLLSDMAESQKRTAQATAVDPRHTDEERGAKLARIRRKVEALEWARRAIRRA